MAFTRRLTRPMLATMFIVGGVDGLRRANELAPAAAKVTDTIVPAAKKAAPQAPVPTDAATLVRINAGVQVVAGLGLATGRAPRLASLLLAGSLVPTTLAGHRFWEESDQAAKTNQQVHFLKNVSLVGGLLISAGDTEGEPGLGWRARRVAKRAKKAGKKTAKSAKGAAKNVG